MVGGGELEAMMIWSVFDDWRWVVRRTRHYAVEDGATSLTMADTMVKCDVAT